MVEQDFGGVKVDVCQDGCQGMWFDWGELARLDEANEGLGEALRAALCYPRVNDDERGKINCPRCQQPLHRHQYHCENEINIDECYECGGMFLDSGELGELREHHMSKDEEAQYVKKMVDSMPEYQQAMADQATRQVRAQALINFGRVMSRRFYWFGR